MNLRFWRRWLRKVGGCSHCGATRTTLRLLTTTQDGRKIRLCGQCIERSRSRAFRRVVRRK